MNLYLTLNERLVDSIAIDPKRRSDKEYIYMMRQVLQDKYKTSLEETRTGVGFYLDPYQEQARFPKSDAQ